MRIGVVLLPETRWNHGGAARWRRAEELGFDHAWTYDHLAWRSLRNEPWFGAVPTLAAAAAVTTRMRLGTLVASPNFRHPVPFAREVLALDDIAEGRFTLGMGAGGEGWDAEMLGHPPWTRSERSARFAEFTDLLDQLLSTPEVSATGRYYSAVEARSYPGCIQRPRVPMLIAAAGPRAMDVAARFGQGWVTTGDAERGPLAGAAAGAELVGAQLATLARACNAIGRDPSELDKVVLTGLLLDGGISSREAFADAIAEYAAVGVTDLIVHWPRAGDPYRGDESAFVEIVGGHLADR